MLPADSKVGQLSTCFLQLELPDSSTGARLSNFRFLRQLAQPLILCLLRCVEKKRSSWCSCPLHIASLR